MKTDKRINFKRILCPIGLIPDSDEALRYAIALSRAYEAKLTVIHSITEDEIVSGIDYHHLREGLKDQIEKQTCLPALTAVDSEVIIVEGNPQTAIPQEAAKRAIDLIVMRSRRRPLAAALLGSTAEAVCRTAPCPVMVTHPREQAWEGIETNEVGLKRLLVGYDFSIDSELALAYGLSLAQEYQAELQILHIMPPRAKGESPEITFLPTSTSASFDEVMKRLNLAVSDEARLWCDVKQHVVEGHPYREILNHAEDQRVDLICLGASGTGFGMRALFGSNADRVLRQAPCPVLIARPLKPNMAGREDGYASATRVDAMKGGLR